MTGPNDKYRDALYGAAYKKAMAERGQSHSQAAKVLGVDESTIWADLRNDSAENAQELRTEESEILPPREQYEARKETGKTVEDLTQTTKKYGVIYADPPWEFKVYSGKGKMRSAGTGENVASRQVPEPVLISNAVKLAQPVDIDGHQVTECKTRTSFTREGAALP